MRSGLFVPPFGPLADPAELAGLAARAEESGWDGFFLWDHVVYRAPVAEVADPWIALAAMAMATERLRLGPLVTPLARRRPQIVARQAVTLDHLSGGRLVLGAGLGLDASGGELSAFGEELDDRTRAEMLDEALDLLGGLLSGETVHHRGRHYRADGVRFLPRPRQQPGIPLWLAARWPHRAPVRRALRFDGVFVIDLRSPDQLVELVRDQRPAPSPPSAPFEVVVQGWPGEDPRPWEAAGATWWLVRFDPFDITGDQVRAAIDAGPPPPG